MAGLGGPGSAGVKDLGKIMGGRLGTSSRAGRVPGSLSHRAGITAPTKRPAATARAAREGPMTDKMTLPKASAVNVKGPERPGLPPIDPQAAFDPELQAYAQKYGGHLEDLKEGTGFAMDAMREQMENRRAAARESAEASAVQAGIPFNASTWEAEYDRGINSAMAQEKVGREAQLTQAYQGGLPIVSRPSDERFARLDLDLRRDMGEAGNILDRYKTDVSKYGTDVQAAIGSNNALLGFLSSLMGTMGNMMPNMNLSAGGGSYRYG